MHVMLMNVFQNTIFTSSNCHLTMIWLLTLYNIYSLPASGKLCSLLITSANSLDPDQARQNVGPDLDQSCLPSFISERIFSRKKQS